MSSSSLGRTPIRFALVSVEGKGIDTQSIAGIEGAHVAAPHVHTATVCPSAPRQWKRAAATELLPIEYIVNFAQPTPRMGS